MYADDTNITLAASDLNVLEKEKNNELRNSNLWLMANKLSLNIGETEFVLIGYRQRLQMQTNRQIEIKIDGRKISQVENAKPLGVHIDDKLTWKKTWTKFLKWYPLALVH